MPCHAAGPRQCWRGAHGNRNAWDSWLLRAAARRPVALDGGRKHLPPEPSRASNCSHAARELEAIWAAAMKQARKANVADTVVSGLPTGMEWCARRVCGGWSRPMGAQPPAGKICGWCAGAEGLSRRAALRPRPLGRLRRAADEVLPLPLSRRPNSHAAHVSDDGRGAGGA